MHLALALLFRVSDLASTDLQSVSIACCDVEFTFWSPQRNQHRIFLEPLSAQKAIQLFPSLIAW